MKIRLSVLIWSLVGLVLVLCAGIGALPEPVVLVGNVALGWIGFIGRVGPEIKVNWASLLTALVCLTAALVLGHGLARWIWRETRGQAWRGKWTAIIAAVILLMFTAGIGATGIAHQSAWLARMDTPLFQQGRGRESANRVKCGSNLRQIGQAIMLYAQDNGGKFPDLLEQILLTQDLTAEVFICPSSNHDRAPGTQPAEQARHLHKHCSYIYHGRGLTNLSAKDTPIVCEPLMNHQGGGMNILFAEGRVEWFSPAAAKAVMEKLR